MMLLVLVVVVGTAASAVALRPETAGSLTMWLGLGVPYAVLALIALRRMWNDGTFVDKMKPRWGDLSLGLLIAAVLVLAGWGFVKMVAPAGSPQHAWVLRILLQTGGPQAIHGHVGLALATVGIAASEEIVWRGLVLDLVEEKMGSRRAWLVAAGLYALALAPTVYTLRDPVAGPNPLLVAAALGVGVVWSFLATRLGRLPPLIISHMAFTYFSPALLTR